MHICRLSETPKREHVLGIRSLVTQGMLELGLVLDPKLDNDLYNIPATYAPPSFLLVALENDTVIGTCGVRMQSETIGELRRFYVDEKYRGRGIGKELITKTEEVAKEMGISTLVAFTPASNAKSIQKYREAGFSVELLSEQADDRPFTAKLTKDLPELDLQL